MCIHGGACYAACRAGRQTPREAGESPSSYNMQHKGPGEAIIVTSCRPLCLTVTELYCPTPGKRLSFFFLITFIYVIVVVYICYGCGMCTHHSAHMKVRGKFSPSTMWVKPLGSQTTPGFQTTGHSV